MTIPRRLAPLLLLLGSLIVAGCGSETPPLAPGSYSGTWRYASTLTGSGNDTLYTSTLELTRTSDATINDTLRLMPSGTLLSTTSRSIQFTDVLDGYQRGVEVDGNGGDSTVRYWYFFKVGSRLTFYRGMRFRGNNVGLQGAWALDSNDRHLAHPGLDLTFRDDSVALLNNDTMGPTNGIYHYTVSTNTLLVDGKPLPYGNRYEVIPGYLYITSHADREYDPVP